MPETGSRMGKVSTLNTLIRTQGLSKYYGKSNEIKAVDRLDLEVYQGETFGLLGPNGAGKTTAIRLLNCIIKPTAGNATVGGYDTIKDEMEVKGITGLLAESPGLYEKLSAHEFLDFMGAELLKLFGLVKRKDYLLEGFSRGMKQRILIAAALIHDPPILFLDEPTSTLDPRAALMVKDLIRKLSQDAGKTIFISSHILPVVEELCDRIGIINKGRLVALGTLDEILERTNKTTLEEAFIVLTGGVKDKELLAWREQRGTDG
jgi:ABC-2 type transport system ATP-binding protein